MLLAHVLQWVLLGQWFIVPAAQDADNGPAMTYSRGESSDYVQCQDVEISPIIKYISPPSLSSDSAGGKWAKAAAENSNYSALLP